jgi:hypothetical protein
MRSRIAALESSRNERPKLLAGLAVESLFEDLSPIVQNGLEQSVNVERLVGASPARAARIMQPSVAAKAAFTSAPDILFLRLT